MLGTAIVADSLCPWWSCFWDDLEERGSMWSQKFTQNDKKSFEMGIESMIGASVSPLEFDRLCDASRQMHLNVPFYEVDVRFNLMPDYEQRLAVKDFISWIKSFEDTNAPICEEILNVRLPQFVRDLELCIFVTIWQFTVKFESFTATLPKEVLLLLREQLYPTTLGYGPELLPDFTLVAGRPGSSTWAGGRRTRSSSSP